MNNRRSAWIDRRGQHGAEAAIDQVIERHVQAGEQVQHLADDLIEDSPYQARQNFSTASLEELAQGMRESGFQGVLIVRPHSDVTKQRRGMVQLVYGHRRRVAWRQVCAERGKSCLVPVVVRAVSDAQLLTIGAQENLQRQDLDPIEEAQIVAWHERLFFEKNQAEIGAMLGKSSDWVSVRSRIHKLPDALKERLHQRPRAIKQVLELATLYQLQPQMALELADRVVNEQLTVEGIRAIIDRQAEDQDVSSPREEKNNRRASATSVQAITSTTPSQMHDRMAAQRIDTLSPQSDTFTADLTSPSRTSLDERSATNPITSGNLQIVVEMLASLASQADELASDPTLSQQLDIAEQSFGQLRRAMVRRLLPNTVVSRAHPYRLLDGELGDLVFKLHHHRVALAMLGPTQGKAQPLYLVICRLPSQASAVASAPERNEVFVAIPGGRGAVLSATNVDLRDWTRRNLQLAQREALVVAALLHDLQAMFHKDAE